MSIKEISGHSPGSDTGVAKRIDAGAQRMIYDVLQATQYSTPIASAVRELSTNAWDSQREKEIAIEILTGAKKASDYYIERNGEQYDDSNFDPSYYELDKLDRLNNTVELKYTRNPGAGFCDLFEITDTGVGLGDKRLEGCLSLGFSSKRNTTEGYGAYGIGSKSAFATGVPMYSITSVHNGRRFKCDCFPYKTLFKTPKFNMELEIENPHIVFSDGTVVYYEETTDLNTTTISFAVKRHNRSKFEEAVEEQLLYLDNVFFTVVDNEQVPVETKRKATKAHVAYVSQNLILSDSAVFNKPHIVVVRSLKDDSGINYGMVDFKELEMEDLYGSIGFKCPVKQSYRDEDGVEVILTDGIAISPSREKVIWNDETKAYVQRVLTAAVEEAQGLVSEQITGATTLTEWVNLCRGVFGRIGAQAYGVPKGSKEDVLNRLSKIVDSQKISPEFTLEGHTLKYSNNIKTLFPGVVIEKVTMDYSKNISITEIENVSELPPNFVSMLYRKDANYSKGKNYHICANRPDRTFLAVKMKEIHTAETDGVEDQLKIEFIEKQSSKNAEKLFWQTHFMDSITLSYDNVDVPAEIEQVMAKTEADTLSPSEKRALEAREVGFTLRTESSYSGTGFVLDKVEPSSKELIEATSPVYVFSSDEIDLAKGIAAAVMPLAPTLYEVYGTQGDWGRATKALYSVSPSVYFLSRQYKFVHKPADFPHLIQLNQNLLKKLEGKGNIRPISDLLYQRINGTVMSMDPMIVRMYTVYRIGSEWADGMNYMEYIADIHPVIHAKYKELDKFMNIRAELQLFYNESNPVWKKCDELYEFELYCRTDPSAEDLRNESFRRFIFTDITGAKMVLQEYLDLFQELKDFNEDVGNLLDSMYVQSFKDPGTQLEIKRYLASRNRENWQWGEEVPFEESITETQLNPEENADILSA